MLKRQKILIIIIFLLLMIPYRANAEATLDVKAVIDGKNSSITTPARYCYVYGCRTSITGIKVSVYVKGMEKQTKIVKNGEKFARETINYNFENIQSLSEKISLQSLEEKFKDLPTLVDGFKETWYYDILISFPSLKQEFELLDNIRLDSNNIYNTIVTENKNSSISTYEKYQQRLENSYITIEPILKVTLATKDSRDTLGIFKKYNVAKNYITIDYANQIINHGEIDICGAISDKNFNDWVYIGLLGDCSGNDKNAKCREIYNNTKESQCNASGSPYKNLTKAWNELISNKDKLKGNVQEDTVKEIAKYIMTGNNYIYAGATSDGKLSSEASGTGSISNKINDISTFIYLPSNLTTYNNKSYTKANRNGTNTWKEIAKDYSGYGIGIMVAKIGLNDSYLRLCHYENGEVILGQGMTDVTDCCKEGVWDTDEYGIFVNSDKYKSYCICTKTNYDDLIGKDNGTITEEKLKKNLPKEAKDDLKYCCKSENYGKEGKKTIEKFPKWVNSELDIDYCKGNTNNDNYCVWNGNNTERYQTVNGNELDCCSYDNWGKTNNEREQALKNADKTKTVARNIFENEIPWYSNNCTNKYCVWNGNKTERWQTINGKKLDCCIYSNYGENAKTVTGFKTEDDFKEYGWYKNNNCETDIDIEPPQYCTIQKLQNGDTSCCHQEGLNKWSPSFIKGMQENGYADTPAGLEEYLKYKIGVNKYNKLCGKNECTYEIESLCPSCDNEDTSYGLVMDTVSGFDSTALQLSNETEQCIFKNNEYLYEKNSYCEVYCTEKLEYSFPKKSTLSVTAGTRLVVGGNLSPMESKSTITCRRTEINTAKFESDLKGKIDALITAYKEYTYASVPLNENKIILHKDNATHVSRSEWDCDCKNNVGRGIIDDHICCESVAYEDAGSSHGRLVVAATYTSFDATPIYNDCYGGEWKILSHTTWSESNCGQDGASDPSNRRAHMGECKLTKPDPYPSCVGGHRERTGFESCGSGYSLVGEQCVPDSIHGCSKSGGTVTCKTVSCDSSYGSDLTKRKLVSTYTDYTTSLSNSMCTYAYCSSRNYERYDYQTVDAYRYGYNKSEPQSAQGMKCENDSGYYQTEYENLKETRKKALLAAWNDYNNVINNLNICYDFTNKVKSNYEININLSYQNGSYSIDTPLDKTVSTYTDKNFTQTESTRGYKNCGIMTGIEFLNCEQETKYYQENINGTYATGTSTNTYSYALPNNSSMYRYVNKSSLSEKDSNINSIYIGSHLPVAYNEKDNKIEVELTPSVIKSNLSDTTYITKQRNNFESEICTDPYACDAITPGKTKIVPVYRVISLSNPFPDEDGNGRNTGKNWCNGSDCTNNNQVVQNVIKNNRGVSEDKVYTLTPLYTLVLTPGTIKKIREYNSQTSYGDYSLICEKDTGKYCKSLYLRGEPDKEGNIINDNLEQIGVLKKDKSCAFNEELAGCMPGDKYEG